MDKIYLTKVEGMLDEEDRCWVRERERNDDIVYISWKDHLRIVRKLKKKIPGKRWVPDFKIATVRTSLGELDLVHNS